MPTDPRVDTYIEAQQPFAKPILLHLRALVHAAVPGVGETLKWGRPFFTVKDRPLCFMAAFKTHAAFGFWRAASMGIAEAEGSGSFGRLVTLADLPDDETLRAMLLDAAQEPAPRTAPARTAPRPPPVTPADLEAALAAAPAAAARFGSLAPGHRREYVEWIEGAKRAETRARRLATTIERLSAGETLNQRYAAR